MPVRAAHRPGMISPGQEAYGAPKTRVSHGMAASMSQQNIPPMMSGRVMPGVYTVHRSGAGSPQMPHPMAMAPQAIPIGIEGAVVDLLEEIRRNGGHRSSLSVFCTIPSPDEDRLRIGDFGISKVLESTCAFAKTTIGTPYYLSPEICMEKPYTFSSDIWALGCVVYELACLRVPFDATSLQSLVQKITRGPTPLLPNSYSPELRQLGGDLLHREQTQRPSAQETFEQAKSRPAEVPPPAPPGSEMKKSPSIQSESREVRRERTESEDGDGGLSSRWQQNPALKGAGAICMDGGGRIDPSPSRQVLPSPMVPPKSAFPPSGTRFGMKDDNFELGDELGGGSQGRVFRCKRLGTGNEYAVKVVNTKAISLRERTVASLRREILVMRELHHPRIVNLKEAFWEGDLCFIVMDLARGGDLHGKLEPGKGLGPEASSRHVSKHLLSAIAYMHHHKVMHRDLKPENVLIARSYLGPEPLCAELSGTDCIIRGEVTRWNKDCGCASKFQRPGGVFHAVAMTWREKLGVALLVYGIINAYLFVKFTPVYSATVCGDQTAELKNFEMGETIHVSIEIHVVCSNPNPYQVEILSDTPGHVYVGSDRGTDVGVLTLAEGRHGRIHASCGWSGGHPGADGQ
eukprot:g14959.t1